MTSAPNLAKQIETPQEIVCQKVVRNTTLPNFSAYRNYVTGSCRLYQPGAIPATGFMLTVLSHVSRVAFCTRAGTDS